MNDWFDCLNVRVPNKDSRDRVKAFGLRLDLQTQILNDMNETITKMRVKGKSFLMPFQKGMYIPNSNSLSFLEYMFIFRYRYDK